eukprot:ANDGO_01478.mRNA.1 protein kinase
MNCIFHISTASHRTDQETIYSGVFRLAAQILVQLLGFSASRVYRHDCYLGRAWYTYEGEGLWFTNRYLEHCCGPVTEIIPPEIPYDNTWAVVGISVNYTHISWYTNVILSASQLRVAGTWFNPEEMFLGIDGRDYNSFLSGSISTLVVFNQSLDLTDLISLPMGPRDKQMEDTNASACVPCPPGSYSSALGAQAKNTCILCPAGTYSMFRGAANLSTCLKLPAGMYSPLTGLRSLAEAAACPANTYSLVEGSQNVSTCLPCPHGMYYSGTGANSSSACAPCAEGEFHNASTGLACERCPPGYFSTYTDCSRCPYNMYSNKVTHFRCMNCSAGMQPSEDASDCVGYPEGSFSNESSEFVCTRCAGGSAPAQGGAMCVECAPGKYANLASGYLCVHCANGMEVHTDRSHCVPCAPHMFSSPLTRFRCQHCSPGSEVLHSLDGCQSCLEGQFSNSSTGYACRQCPLGTRSSLDFSYCIGCALGSVFSNVSRECVACGPGTAADGVFENCAACPPGSVSSSGKQCFPCAAGSSPNIAQTTCIQCRDLFASSSGMSCKMCPPGQTHDLAHASCIPCPNGAVRGFNETKCSFCPLGYVAGANQSQCLSCPPFHISNGTHCSLCRPGSMPHAYQNSCVACDAGMVSPDGQRCQPCPDDSISEDSRQCTLPGRFCSIGWPSFLYKRYFGRSHQWSLSLDCVAIPFAHPHIQCISGPTSILKYYWTLQSESPFCADLARAGIGTDVIVNRSYLLIAADRLPSNCSITFHLVVESTYANNSASFRVEVLPMRPLQAVIDKGPYLRHGVENVLALSAAESVDFEQDDSVPWPYSWTCVQSDTSDFASASPTCTNFVPTSSVNIRFNNGFFTIGKWYSISLVVSKGDRMARTSLLLETTLLVNLHWWYSFSLPHQEFPQWTDSSFPFLSHQFKRASGILGQSLRMGNSWMCLPEIGR